MQKILTMKRLIQLIFFINLGLFVYGIYLQNFSPQSNYEKVMGFGVLLLVFILMPLFIYYRYKDKSIDDYRFKGFQNKNKQHKDEYNA